MEQGRSRFSVEVAQEDIRILYDGREILYWHKDEWMECPQIVPSICEAIRQAYEDQDRLLEVCAEAIEISRR